MKGARVTWETICFPKYEGGLGLKNMVSWNKACILQNIWAIIVKAGSLWIAWIHEYVLKDRSIWQIPEAKNGSWNWNKLLRLRPLAQTFIENKDGREVWKLEGGRYSASTVWGEIRPKKEKISWHRLVWNPFVVPKHAVITWLAILNRLPTVDRLKAWGIDKDGLCSLCKQEQESRDHLFFECSYSKAVWKKVLQLCGLNREVLDWRREFAWAVQKFKGKALITKILKISWNAYIYCIWKERNNRLFVHKEDSIEQVLEHI